MKAKASAAQLASALSEAQSFTDKKSQIPEVRNVLLETVNSSIRVSGTNLATGIATKVNAEVSEKGSLVVDGTIGDILKTCNGDVSLKLNKTSLKLTSDGYTGNFQILGPDDFPRIPDPGRAIDKAEISANELTAILGLTTFAVSNKDETPLASILLKFMPANDAITAIAADGYRFSIATLRGKTIAFEEDMDVLVPGDCADTLRSPVKNAGDGKVTIGVTPDKKVLIYTKEFCWFAGQFSGDFPDVKGAISNDSKCMIMAKTDELLVACKRLMATLKVTKSKEAGFVTLNLDPSSGKMIMDCSQDETGSGKSTLKPVFDNGSEKTVTHLGIKFLMDAISALQSNGASSCQFVFPSNPGAPILIKSAVDGVHNLQGISPSQI